jgi:ketosteroid isomerase-like protein
MSLVERYLTHALAFREARASDDWSVVGPFFTEDAVYDVRFDPPLGGRFEGRPAILAYFKESVDRYDRRFESREGAFVEGPREDGDTVWVRGRVVCRSAGVPELVIELEEIAQFEGDRICRLEDRYDEGTKARMRAYLAAHGAKLGISG